MTSWLRVLAVSLVLAFCPASRVPAAPAAKGDATFRQAVAAELARATAPRVPMAVFLSRPEIEQVVLSPDGRHVAYLRRHGEDRAIWLLPTEGGAARRLLADTDATRLEFTRDGHWLLLESPQRVYAVAVDGSKANGIVVTLGGPDERTLLGLDPRAPAAVVVREKALAADAGSSRWRLLRIDMRGRRTQLIVTDHRPVAYAFDARDRLRFLSHVDGDAVVIMHRDEAGHWREVTRCVRLRRCMFLSASADGRSLLLTGNLQGDLLGLERLDADGRLHVVQRDPRAEADQEWVALDPLDGRALAVGYLSTRAEQVGLTPAMKAQFAHLDRLFPGRDLRVWVGRGADARWLLSVRSSRMQGEHWYLYDPRNHQARRILDVPRLDRDRHPIRPLPQAVAARKIPLQWRASDGMRLHGFVSLPPGTDPAHLPLVALVHGGPWSHAKPEFAAYVQLLVNRGYAVFEPNFRGSTGFGRRYLMAAHGDFGNGRVQQDIVEGVHALLRRHIGDPDRVGIVGASFGGYSTLLGLTWQPELFKVGVAIVPPPDFAWTLRWIARGREALALSPVIPFRDWMRQLDLNPADAARMKKLHAQSPLSNAERMTRPLLMIAGARDRRVALRGVIAYAARLQALGKDVSLLVDPDAGHTTKNDLLRQAQGYLILRMLHRHLGGAAPHPPGAVLRAYIQRNLRIDGRGLGSL